MSERRQVRVRRAPKVGVFLGLGALIGVVAALLGSVLVPADPQYPTSQVLGFLVLILAPVGAAVGGLVAIVLDTVATRRARVVDAERSTAAAPPADADADAEAQAQAEPGTPERP